MPYGRTTDAPVCVPPYGHGRKVFKTWDFHVFGVLTKYRSGIAGVGFGNIALVKSIWRHMLRAFTRIWSQDWFLEGVYKTMDFNNCLQVKKQSKNEAS